MPAAGVCLRAGHELKETQEIQSLSGESLILIPATGKRHNSCWDNETQSTAT